VAETAGYILEDGYVLVEIHQLAECFYGLISGALKCWRVTCALGIAQNRRWQCAPLSESLIEDESNFAPNPFYLEVQIGRENARRIRVVRLSGWLTDELSLLSLFAVLSLSVVIPGRYASRGDDQN
jgi:hypothetical protein